MFEDIIGEIRRIEILYADGVWRLSRIKKLNTGFTFRYIDNPKVKYIAGGRPFKDDNGTWAVVGTPVEG